MRNLALCFLLATSALTTACAPTSTSRSAGQAIDDATLTAKVKTEIGQKLGVVQAAAINVDTYRGAVSLSGFMDDQQKIQAAVQATSSVQGVEKVFNNLHLKSKTQ